MEAADDAREADFIGLYSDVAPALYAWASLRIRPSLRARLDPEDLVQEVCCRAFAGRERYDPTKGPFRGWVFGIAHVVLKNALEALARSPRGAWGLSEESQQILDRVPADATSVSSRVARSERVRRLIDQARDLSELDRRLLILRGLIGLKHGEVAQRLEVTVDTAEKRWQRLRTRLAERGDLHAILVD